MQRPHHQHQHTQAHGPHPQVPQQQQPPPPPYQQHVAGPPPPQQQNQRHHRPPPFMQQQHQHQHQHHQHDGAVYSSPPPAQPQPQQPQQAYQTVYNQHGQPMMVPASAAPPPTHHGQQMMLAMPLQQQQQAQGGAGADTVYIPVQTAQGLVYVPQSVMQAAAVASGPPHQKQHQQPHGFLPPQPQPANNFPVMLVQQQQQHQQPQQQRARTPTPPPAPGDTEPGPRQLIVNYLPPDMVDGELQSLFAQHGDVEAARVIYDKSTGLTKGFGFVYFVKHAHARAAVAAFNGLPLRGKHLKVGYANPQRPVSSLTPSSPQQAPGSHAPTPVATTPSAVTFDSNAAVGGGGATPTIVVGTQSLAEQRRRSSGGASVTSLVSPHAARRTTSPGGAARMPAAGLPPQHASSTAHPVLPPPVFRRVRLGSDASAFAPPNGSFAQQQQQQQDGGGNSMSAMERGRLASDASAAGTFVTPTVQTGPENGGSFAHPMLDLTSPPHAASLGFQPRRDSVGTVLSTGSWDDVATAAADTFDAEELIRAVRRASEANDVDMAAFAAPTNTDTADS